MRKGDIHRFRVPKALGHEQAGPRFEVIVQANELLPRSVVLVAPTSLSARAAPFRSEVKVANAATKVLVEQWGPWMCSVSAKRSDISRPKKCGSSMTPSSPSSASPNAAEMRR